MDPDACQQRAVRPAGDRLRPTSRFAAIAVWRHPAARVPPGCGAAGHSSVTAESLCQGLSNGLVADWGSLWLYVRCGLVRLAYLPAVRDGGQLRTQETKYLLLDARVSEQTLAGVLLECHSRQLCEFSESALFSGGYGHNNDIIG